MIKKEVITSKKLKNIFRPLGILFFLVLLNFCFTANAKAVAYDFYVDKDNSKEADGTEENPFKKINDAIEEAQKESGAKKIYIKEGTYSESLTLSESIELYGKDADDVAISGSVFMEDNSSLFDLTVRGAGYGIRIASNANVKIENCKIKENGEIGVEILEGNGKLVLENSRVYNNKTKGLYVRRGNRVEITNSIISDNEEEGIDLRDNIDGFIENNEITGNGESGIEVVVGSSDLEIEGNLIKNNKSSGIANQFYSEFKKSGQILVKDNKISKNRKYGVDCNIPQGGNPPTGYWRNSIELEDNIIENNGIDPISVFCKFVEAVDPQEEQDNILYEENGQTETLVEAEQNQEPAVDVQTEEEEPEHINEEYRKEFEEKMTEVNLVIAEFENNQQKIGKIGKLRLFFFGTKDIYFYNLKNNIIKLNSQLIQLEEIASKASDEQLKTEINEKISSLTEKRTTVEKFLNNYSKKTGFFNWLNQLLGLK